MDTFINIGNYNRLSEKVIQSRINTIADFYHSDNYINVDQMTTFGDDDTVIRVYSEFNYLEYASKEFYESNKWSLTINIISYDEWLSTLPSRYLLKSGPDGPEKHNHYIYLLKDNLSFALMTMSGDIADDYITLLDYSDISEVSVYTADFLLNSVLSGFDMDKFYQIPVKNADHATINDVWEFLKKEK